MRLLVNRRGQIVSNEVIGWILAALVIGVAGYAITNAIISGAG